MSTPSWRREAAEAEWGLLEPGTLDSPPQHPLLTGLHPGPRAAHTARCLVNAPCPHFCWDARTQLKRPTSWQPSSVWLMSPLLACDRWTGDPLRAETVL